MFSFALKNTKLCVTIIVVLTLCFSICPQYGDSSTEAGASVESGEYHGGGEEGIFDDDKDDDDNLEDEQDPEKEESDIENGQPYYISSEFIF